MYLLKKNGSNIGLFSTFEKANQYLVSISTFKNEFSIEKIKVDKPPENYNNIFPFQVIIDSYGKIINIISVSVSSCYNKPFGRFKIGSRSKGPNWFVNLFSENKDQASVKALEIREDLLMVGVWPK